MVTFGEDFFIAPHFVPISMDEMLDFLQILLELFGLVRDAELTTIELLNGLVAPLLTYCYFNERYHTTKERVFLFCLFEGKKHRVSIKLRRITVARLGSRLTIFDESNLTHIDISIYYFENNGSSIALFIQ